MQPLITVIIPFYNAEKYLQRCIESVVSQTYTHLQIVLVDDGSTDGSADIAHQFVDTDNRCSLWQQSNKGVSAARNFGLQQAKGDFVTFVDADDYLALDFYNQLASNADCDIVQCGLTRVSLDGTPKILKSRFSYRFVSPCIKLIRRQFLTDNAIQFVEGERYEDVLFSLDLWVKNPQIRVIDCVGYVYCANEGSFTAQKHDSTHLFYLLRQRMRQPMLPKIRLVALFTYCKLKLHFWLNIN